MSEDDATFDEKKEAEALAEALDQGRASEALPDDALEAAVMLRYSRDGGRLDEGRRDAIFDEVVRTARRPEVERSLLLSRAFWVRAFALSAAAVAVIVALSFPRAKPLPAPPRELLQAQSRAAGGDLASLDAQMTPYRVSVYSTIEKRYR